MERNGPNLGHPGVSHDSELHRSQVTKHDVTSDGQFSDYNEIMKSPLRDPPEFSRSQL